MQFTKEDLEFFIKVHKRMEEFKTFVLDRLQAYSYDPTSMRKSVNGQLVKLDPIDNVHVRGWSYWTIDKRDLWSGADTVRCLQRLDDEHASTMTTAIVEMPWGWVFGDLEHNRDYQLYLKLKARFGDYDGEGYPQGTG